MIGIYKITSPTNKIYIGQSINIKRRWSDYRNINRTCRPTRIINSIRKHGADKHSFEVLVELPNDIDAKVLDLYENIYITQFRSCGFVMLNVNDGGGAYGKHTEETKQKLREINKGKEPWNKGKTNVYSEASKERRSKSLLGHSVTDKARLIWAKNATGKKYRLGMVHTDFTKNKISETKKGNSPAWNRGLPWPKEVKDKMYKFPKGHTPYNKGKEHKYHTEESRNKLSIAHKLHWKYRKENNISISLSGENCPASKLNKRSVEDIINVLFEEKTSYKEVGKLFNVSQNTIIQIKNNLTWKIVLPEVRGKLLNLKSCYKYSGRKRKIQ